MPGPYPIELRERIVRHVEGGATHRATAAKFEVSIKFVNDMMKLKRETGALKPRRLGNPSPGKLAPFEQWLRDQVAHNGELTLDELAWKLETEHSIKVSPSAIWRKLKALNISYKKNR